MGGTGPIPEGSAGRRGRGRFPGVFRPLHITAVGSSRSIKIPHELNRFPDTISEGRTGQSSSFWRKLGGGSLSLSIMAEFYGVNPDHGSRIARINQLRGILYKAGTEGPDTAFVPSTGLMACEGTQVHFDRASSIIFGQRYAEAMTALQSWQMERMCQRRAAELSSCCPH